MAGHSKWANIQHRKQRQDDKRGRLFSKLIREVTVAARAGGPNPADNPRLRLAVEKAQAANMPKDTVARAIRRGAGDGGGAAYAEVRYEGYGPGGAALLIDCLTDNRNRTVSEVRHALARHGGRLGESGSVAYLFRPAGVLAYAPGADGEALLEAALEAGAEDVQRLDDGAFEVLAAPADFAAARERLAAAGFPPDHAALEQRAQSEAALSAADAARLAELLERLEELDDVQAVATNAAPEPADGD